MSVPTVKFKKDGGPLSIEIKCGHAQPGAYVLRVWDKELTSVVFEEFGDFQKVHDDRYFLPEPPEANDQRLVQSITRVAIVPPEKKFHVVITLRQGNDVLKGGVIEESGKSENTTVRVHLRALLEVK